jgi:hypothetical protein
MCWPHVNPVPSGAVGKDCQRRLLSRPRFVRACSATDLFMFTVTPSTSPYINRLMLTFHITTGTSFSLKLTLQLKQIQTKTIPVQKKEHYQTKVDGRDNCLALWPLPVDDNRTTRNHPGYIIFSMVKSDVKTKLYILNTEQQTQKKKRNLASVC